MHPPAPGRATVAEHDEGTVDGTRNSYRYDRAPVTTGGWQLLGTALDGPQPAGTPITSRRADKRGIDIRLTSVDGTVGTAAHCGPGRSGRRPARALAHPQAVNGHR